MEPSINMNASMVAATPIQPAPQAPKKSRRIVRIVIVASVFIVGVIVGVVTANLTQQTDTSNEPTTVATEKQNKDTIHFSINDADSSGYNYEVSIDFAKKTLKFTKTSCDAENCETSPETTNATLTDAEVEKIRAALSNLDLENEDNNREEKLSLILGALEYIALGDEKMATKAEDESGEDTFYAFYDEYDLNNDGVVTYREFGDSYLDISQ